MWKRLNQMIKDLEKEGNTGGNAGEVDNLRVALEREKKRRIEVENLFREKLKKIEKLFNTIERQKLMFGKNEEQWTQKITILLKIRDEEILKRKKVDQRENRNIKKITELIEQMERDANQRASNKGRVNQLLT